MVQTLILSLNLEKKRNKKKKLIFNQIFSRIKKILRTKYKIKIK